MDYKIWVHTARLNGILGRELVCDEHGMFAWVRSSLSHDTINSHIRTAHVIMGSGSSLRSIGITERVK